MIKKIIIHILAILFLLVGNTQVFAANTSLSDDSNEVLTTLRVVDIGTFNEYKYRLTEQFFILRQDIDVRGSMQIKTLNNLFKIAQESRNYLPDDLRNKNLYEKLGIALQQAAKYPNNDNYYEKLKDALGDYMSDVSIKSVKGTIKATPKEGNAPLNVTLRGVVKDDTGAKIPSHNYVWWIDVAGKRKVIGSGQSINYIFKEEGTFAVFLDVISAHKNEKGYTDVLPFRSRADIKIKEKIASVILKVNGDYLRTQNDLKFTPDESGYGLVFDATSSTPTGGARFTKTEWDFGNGVKRSNKGEPKIERIKYTKEGEYTVKFQVRTNENKTVKREFLIKVHDPIATITASQEKGFLGDKFTFSAKPTGSDQDLSYSWSIVDIERDKTVFTKAGSSFTYSFLNKGKYNVKLRVTTASGDIDDRDSQIIYIDSRAPVADFSTTIPKKHEPNTIQFDASKSYDLDGVDDGKLSYEWIISGVIVDLDNANENGSIGTYTFDSVGEKSVTLRVTDPEGIFNLHTDKVKVKSTLSVNYAAYPRVAQRNTNIRFIADSQEAKVFLWDFGDGTKRSVKESQINHKYDKSGNYTVKLEVVDKDDQTNFYSKKVYIGESNSPIAFMNLKKSTKGDVPYLPNQCEGESAYMVDRSTAITFDASESVDITGNTGGMEYSWKLGKNKYFSDANFAQKFDELGCFEVQLSVKSVGQGTTDRMKKWVRVDNLLPTLSSVDVQVVDGDADPIVVKVSALGANDPDGVIQSYLWYYYTDIDVEPQDFRATKTANTTFVLPKVTGNYYFVVLMKDDNESRVSSEDITGSKYSITLTGNDMNIPLIELEVNDSSIAVGEQVVFSAKVENILGKNLSKKSEYSWDLDGDGFYEHKTENPTITYTYENSGEFHAKVKAKHKGYSNTKNITMNVSNLLQPDVEYVSIGNTFVFFNTSYGKTEKIEWNLGDGTIVKGKNHIVHRYEGKENSYDISMTLIEGTKKVTEKFHVTKNVKNMLYARKKGLVLFSNKTLFDGTISVESKKDKVLFYVGESKNIAGASGEVVWYGIDLDLDYDSDINGGTEDDKDIKFSAGQNNDIFEVKLNTSKTQKIRIVSYDIHDEIIDTRDIILDKTYIEESEMSVDDIQFDNVSDAEKLIIERLKSEIDKLPKEHRLKSLMYVQKLQEEWYDVGEKTKVIVEFEGYLAQYSDVDSDEIYSSLESLILIEEEDKSDKNMSFVALKNLVPKEITCDLKTDVENGTCYDAIIERLEIINVNPDIDENRAMGNEILDVIKVYEPMRQDIGNFKAILKPFVYGGLDNVPEVDKKEEREKPQDPNERDVVDSGIIGVLKGIAMVLAVIVGIFLGIFLLFFLLFKIKNKDEHIGFQDYIIELTYGKKPAKVSDTDVADDILNELDSDLSKSIPKDENKKEDKPKSLNAELKTSEKKSTGFSQNENNNISSEKKDEVPSWLKGSMATGTPDKKTDLNRGIPQTETKEKEKVIPEIKKPDSVESRKMDGTDDLDKLTELETEKNIPDWLKGAKGNVEQEKNTDEKKGEKIEKKTFVASDKEDKKRKNFGADKKRFEKPKNINNFQRKAERKSQEDVPDWLKGSFDEGEGKKDIQQTQSETKPKESEKNNTKKSINKAKKTEDIKTEAVTGSEGNNNTTEDISSGIPDWLKGSMDDTGTEKEKKIEETPVPTESESKVKAEDKTP
ncbi:MAG: PKD domain-containing protein, partial [Candidatus Gracilibacteria bacterium]|nr:PKD domain-containing protein [Candidatus Gracilibacteria bacterium]